MTRFLTLFDTVVTDPLEDIPTVNELEKWLKEIGFLAFTKKEHSQMYRECGKNCLRLMNII